MGGKGALYIKAGDGNNLTNAQYQMSLFSPNVSKKLYIKES